MSSDPTTPEVYCRQLLICRTIWYDATNPDDGCSLARVIVNIRPPAGVTGPFVVHRLFVFARLSGDIGDYTARVRLVRVEQDQDGEEVGHLLDEWGPSPCPVTGFDLVETRIYVLSRVRFDGPGVYEFQLWLDELDGPVGWDRIRVPEVIPEEP